MDTWVTGGEADQSSTTAWCVALRAKQGSSHWEWKLCSRWTWRKSTGHISPIAIVMLNITFPLENIKYLLLFFYCLMLPVLPCSCWFINMNHISKLFSPVQCAIFKTAFCKLAGYKITFIKVEFVFHSNAHQNNIKRRHWLELFYFLLSVSFIHYSSQALECYSSTQSTQNNHGSFWCVLPIFVTFKNRHIWQSHTLFSATCVEVFVSRFSFFLHLLGYLFECAA